MVLLILVSSLITVACIALHIGYDWGRARSTATTFFGLIAAILLTFTIIGYRDYHRQSELSEARANIIKDYQEAERKLLDACELNLPRTQKCEIIAVPKE